MANLKKGDECGGYVIEEELSAGAFAKSYRATKGGRNYFFKQYTSPKPSVPWFRGYVDYQAEIKHRVQSSALRGFTYEFVEFFEATRPPRNSPSSNQYYQVFEWVPTNLDLAGMIESRDPSWDQRLTWAKVIAGSIDQLHQQDIIHSDLKPENLILIEDPSIAIGFRLKLIDMDFSLLSDRKAPWDGVEGYVGTPGWFSPEHLTKTIPIEKSDVFTCSLILYELLAQGNPYQGLDDDDYREQVLNFNAPLPQLKGRMPTGNDEAVKEILHRCLSPDELGRPTAFEVNQVLNNRNGRGRVRPTAPTPTSTSTSTSTSTPSKPPALTLTAGGQSISFNITTKLSEYSVRQCGEDSQFWDNNWQMTLENRDDGWYVVPNNDATNETILNSKAVTSSAKLSDGDELGVGRESKGIVKLPLKVALS